MNFSDETLMAYADGELDAATRAAVEAALATDAQLAQRVARHRALRGRLRAAFDPVLDEPLPERLLASVRGAPAQRHAANVVALPRAAAPRWSWPQWGAIAASLVGGALLGPLLLRTPAGGALVTRDGQVLASGALARALTEQLASSQPPGTPVQIGVSFRGLLPHVRAAGAKRARRTRLPRTPSLAARGAGAESRPAGRRHGLPAGGFGAARQRGAHAR